MSTTITHSTQTASEQLTDICLLDKMQLKTWQWN